MGAHELAFVGLAGSGLGTALGVPMIWPRAARNIDARLLGMAVLLMSAIAALISARLAGLVGLPAVDHGINVLGLGAFSVLLLYTWHATGVRLQTRHVGWLLAPGFTYTLIAVARTLLTGDSRVHFVWLLPVVLGFTAASAFSIWRRGEQRRALVPAKWIILFVAILNVAQVVRMEFGHVAPIRALVPLVLFGGFLAVAAYGAWRAFAAMPHALPDEATAPAAPRYARSGIDDADARQLLQRIDDAMTRDRLFARPDLTLRDLARAVDATPHQLSEVLNRFAGTTYHDLINRRRVDAVKAELLNPASDGFTIEGIGASAGFASRSALYAAFKRLEGTTPTAFRATRRQH